MLAIVGMAILAKLLAMHGKAMENHIIQAVVFDAFGTLVKISYATSRWKRHEGFTRTLRRNIGGKLEKYNSKEKT